MIFFPEHYQAPSTQDSPSRDNLVGKFTPELVEFDSWKEVDSLASAARELGHKVAAANLQMLAVSLLVEGQMGKVSIGNQFAVLEAQDAKFVRDIVTDPRYENVFDVTSMKNDFDDMLPSPQEHAYSHPPSLAELAINR